MAKKKRKPASQQQPTASGPELEVKNLLVSLLEMCGTEVRRAETTRILRQFAQRFAVTGTSSRKETPSTEDLERLLENERTMESLRSLCSELEEYLRLEREEFNIVHRQFETRVSVAVSDESKRSLVLIARSFKQQYLRQLHKEQKILRYDLPSYLDTMYLGHEEETQGGLSGKIEGWLDVLEERRNFLLFKYEPLLKRAAAVALSSSDAWRNPTRGEHTKKKMLDLMTTPCQDVVVKEFSMVRAANPLEAMDKFVESPFLPSLFTAILTVGPVGSGKTYLCDRIEDRAASVKVIRPSIPVDFLASKVGQMEDDLISMFLYASSLSEKCVIIMDDVEYLAGGHESLDRTLGSARRKTTFFALMDMLHDHKHQIKSQILLICTSSEYLEGLVSRCDKVFTIGPADEEERKELIKACLGLRETLTSETQEVLNHISEYTAGRSRSELAQHCRQVLGRLPGESTTVLLTSMISTLQSMKPESVRSGLVDNFVDMTIFSAEDLLREVRIANSFPLFGESAAEALAKMKSLVLAPLCRAQELEEILHRTTNSSRTRVFCGGALLTGSPGTGKTVLARYVASEAARLLPSVKLLDISCTSLVHKEVGGSERAMHHLFQTARACAPCILLMEGIENVAAVRGHDNTTEGTMDRLLSTLLTELDGVKSNFSADENQRIAIVATTHNVRWIDPALRRPGRLDQTIDMQLPDYDSRVKIVHRELQGFQFEDGSPSFVAQETSGKTGAQIVAACQEARFASLSLHLNNTEPQTQLGQLPLLTIDHFRSVI